MGLGPSPASSAPTARPIPAAQRSTHGRETPATLPPSGSVPRGLRPDARRGLPSTIGPPGAGSETAPQRPDCSGEWLEAGTYLDSLWHVGGCVIVLPPR